MEISLLFVNIRVGVSSFFKKVRFKKTVKLRAIISFILLSICISGEVFGQRALVTEANRKVLTDLSAKLNAQYFASHQLALALAKIHGWPVFMKGKNGSIMSLQGVNKLGFPVYLITHDNLIAAETTNTNAVQPGGSLGLNLSGSSPGLNNKLAEWDGGSVYAAHQEFAGKTITLHDPATPIVDHSTHVAGTMIATGVYPPVKGMAFNATTLQSYDFNNDIAEMSAAAPGLLLSNHSYGDQAGWYPNDVAGRWEWYGLPGDAVDYKFGFYDQRTQAFDQIAYSAPYYLIVESAGNSNGYLGPDVGADYWGYASSTDQTLVDKGPRPSNISSGNGYDLIATTSNAKNTLTVGAVNPLPNGPATSQDIVIAPFSSWGPTDDGRVKPDIVGDGVNVLSTGILSPTDYKTFSGTSMAAPNVTGSLYLLQEYYAQKHAGSFMHSATLKGLACATAFDAGNPGPDYIYGWGLLNMAQAAQAITDNGTFSLITEKTLKDPVQTFNVVASGNGPLCATICWTDPAGTPTQEGVIDSRVPKLVNDLDIRVSDGTTTFLPWVLDPSNPSGAAKKGDNIVDNVEQILIPGAAFGKTYTITVSHKRTLQSGSQDFSLIVTGIGGPAYCASAPLSSADSRIDNVTLSNLNNTPAAGCTTYSDFTGLPAVQLTQGTVYPLSISLGTCGANFDKAANVYIDWNGDGIFQANELVATTNVIHATGVYTTNITVPASVVPGAFGRMRVVLTETGNPSVIRSCGSYSKGETQDYTVQFVVNYSTASLIIPGTVTGLISACQGVASVSPVIEQFTIKGQNLAQDITANAPPGFEISLTPTGGFGNSLTLTQTGGTVASTIIYVRSSTSAAAGNISGNVILTAAGVTEKVKVTANIHVAPIISTVPDQGPYANGATTLPINFNGTAENYDWVNDTPGIGLPATGSGNIPSFTAVNNTGSTIVATVTVTPTPYRFAYIVNAGSNNVSVINLVTNKLVTNIPVGSFPGFVSASQDGNWVYVSNQESNNVSVINTTSNTVTATINVGLSPAGIGVSPDGSKVYVANSETNTISVIDCSTNTVTSNITVGSGPVGLVISPDGSRIYVTNAISNSVSVINTANNKVTATIPINLQPSGIAISPDGSKVYAVNLNSNNVSVIDAITNKVVSVISVGLTPSAVCVSPDGTYVYVCCGNSGFISVINTVTNIVSNITEFFHPEGLSFSLDGSKLYVANFDNGTMSTFDAANNNLIFTISVGTFPFSIGNFVSRGPGCDGIPTKFTITIRPQAAKPSITTNTATGTIFACQDSASANPDIQQFTASGSDLIGNIIVSAPAGFEISLTAFGGYTNTLTLTQSAGVVNSTVIYVRSAASAPAGTLTGSVVLTTTGTVDQNVTVTGTVSGQVSPSVTINAPSFNICTGGAVTFTATPVNSGTTPAYQWLVNGNPAGTNNAVFISNTLANGDVISCVITANAACIVPASATSNSVTVTVSSPQSPSVNIQTSTNDICEGTPVAFTSTLVNGGSAPAYQWLVNGNPAGTNSPAFTTGKLANGDVVSCVMTSNAPCATPAAVTSNSITMNINPLPVVGAGGNKTISIGNSITLDATVKGSIMDITWSPATGLDNNKILNPVASPVSTTVYTLTVQTISGCLATDNAKVSVQPKSIVVPNAFTPNGDNINDTWVIKYLDAFTTCTVRVYNRWGQLVYSSIGYGIPWNGVYNGTYLSAGVYYYVIDLKNNSPVLSGSVTIIR